MARSAGGGNDPLSHGLRRDSSPKGALFISNRLHGLHSFLHKHIYPLANPAQIIINISIANAKDLYAQCCKTFCPFGIPNLLGRKVMSAAIQF